MAVSSRLGAAQDGLYGLLRTRQQLPGSPLRGVQLSLGWPADPQSEICSVAEQASSDQEWSSTGLQVASHEDEERLRLEVRILVRRSGSEFAPARDRALEIAGEVAAAVRADWTLGGAVADSTVVGTEMDGGADGEARYCGVTVRLEARAYLA